MKVYKFYWNFDDEIPTFEFTIIKDVNYFFDMFFRFLIF